MPVFRIKEAANLLGVSPDTLRRWAEGGRIETINDASGRLAVDGVASLSRSPAATDLASRDLTKESTLRRSAIIAIGLLAVAAAGCSSSGSSSSSSSSSGSSSSKGTITVFAAASLTGSFTTLGKQFEAAHPGDTVKFSFGPSSGLSTQITSGAPADVFASAAPANMDTVVKAGDASSPQTFAENTAEVAVPPSNPGHVKSVNDLAKSSLKVALCQPLVPCGVVAADVFKNVGITVKPVTLQPDVKSVLTQVETGNVDAGMVYVTDVKAAGSKVMGVAIPASDNATTSYPIATISDSKEKSIAQAFVAYVLSPAGQKVLAAAGFEKP
jgi:molybdate transport system substrate-binding protein